MIREFITYNVTSDIPLKFRYDKYNEHSLLLNPFHIHSEIEIIYIKEGKLVCRYNNEEKTLTEGDIIIFNKNFVHETEATTNTAYYLMNIPIDFFVSDTSQLLYALIDTYDIFYLKDNTPLHNELKEYLEKFFLHKYKEENPLKEYTLGYVYLIISFLKKINMISTFENKKDENIKRLIPALNYMKENYKEKITVSEIAKTVNFNINYFERLFKKTFNITVVEYINTLRLNKAVKLLFTTSKKLTEISDICGFSSPAHFNMIFKKKYKMPPSAYKKAKNNLSTQQK